MLFRSPPTGHTGRHFRRWTSKGIGIQQNSIRSKIRHTGTGDHVCFSGSNQKHHVVNTEKIITCSDLSSISAVPASAGQATPEEAWRDFRYPLPASRLKSGCAIWMPMTLCPYAAFQIQPTASGIFVRARKTFMLCFSSAIDNAYVHWLGYGDSELISKVMLPRSHLIRWMEQYGNEIEMASGTRKQKECAGRRRPSVHRQPIAPLQDPMGMGYLTMRNARCLRGNMLRWVGCHGNGTS